MGFFLVKANHPPRCVKGNLRKTKNIVGNFVTCTGGRYGGLFLDLYGSTWNRGCSQRTSKNISRKRVLIQLEQLELLTLFT